MSTWQDIWQRKALNHEEADYSLAQLMKLDGYDISCSAVSVDGFRDFAAQLKEKLAVTEGQSVLEIGCGAGALLKAFDDLGLTVAGLDYTDELVQICRAAIPGGVFETGEAKELDFEKKDFDAVVSHSVFHYFPSTDYALESFSKMIDHTREGGIVALTDMHLASMKEAHEKHRMEMIGEAKFKELYSELSHSYFDPADFVAVAKEKCAEVSVEDQFIKTESAAYKFNLFARK
ncbi:MAG: class I SAM-dependent methyltransferase [Pseudomonadota bacterium]